MALAFPCGRRGKENANFYFRTAYWAPFLHNRFIFSKESNPRPTRYKTWSLTNTIGRPSPTFEFSAKGFIRLFGQKSSDILKKKKKTSQTFYIPSLMYLQSFWLRNMHLKMTFFLYTLPCYITIQA